MVRARISSKLSKLSGPRDEIGDRARLVAGDARRYVDEHVTAHELGMAVSDEYRSEAPERHAGEGGRIRGERSDHDRHVVGEVLDSPGTVASAVGMAVSREVDRKQRSPESQRDTVPGVCILGASVEQHDLGIRVAPRES